MARVGPGTLGIARTKAIALSTGRYSSISGPSLSVVLPFHHSQAGQNLYQLGGFVAGGLLTWLGARRGWPEVMNTAVVFFVIFLYTKLFDWWWAVMPKFLFFLVLGLVALLVILVLKRLRAVTQTEGGR